ncbi:hypothetical protein B7486_13000 [cyanobacterium TDX16]|nr:hypothetical protein B7486_13000 [cyanobacterium TDX16]
MMAKTKKPAPIRNGGNGRDSNGKFAPGNPGGPGNPSVRKTRAISNAFRKAITDRDLRAIALALVRQARAGDVQAAIAVLDRVLGKPVNRIEMLGAERDAAGPQFSGLLIRIVDSKGREITPDSAGEDGNGHRMLPGPALDGGVDRERN